jgi:hypothetical protein
MNKTALVFMLIPVFLFSCTSEKADLILMNGEICTMEDEQTRATAVVIKGNKIVDVLDNDSDIKKHTGKDTRIIDLNKQFVVPGFIDGHVHFNNAGALINDANLLTISDKEGLRKEIIRVVDILDDGEWITGGLWGAYEQWELGASRSRSEKIERWKPDRWMIDDITPANPCFLYSYDRQLFLANSLALERAGLTDKILPGMEIGSNGIPSGLILSGSPAVEMINTVIKPKSHERLMDENRSALAKLRECGIVEIQDIVHPEQTERFIELQERGELTCRVWIRPDLSRCRELKDQGFTMGLNPRTKQKDPWLRYGALKGYVDGIMGDHSALFFEPYDDQPDNYGHYREHTSDDPVYMVGNMDKMYQYIIIAKEAGFVTNIHAIGDKGIALLLDIYERLMVETGHDLEGYRVIHAQVIRQEDFPRFRKLNVIAEVNPYHLSDDMRWMEERIGYDRCKGAYAFKSLLDNGATLSFGSDWPGTSVAEYHVHPKYLIHAAVNRTTIKGEPEGGWFPEQKISVYEALKAYTINNAYAAFEADVRGSIKPGKLADITVCDLNLLTTDPENILDMNVVMTIVDGVIVYEKEK